MEAVQVFAAGLRGWSVAVLLGPVSCYLRVSCEYDAKNSLGRRPISIN